MSVHVSPQAETATLTDLLTAVFAGLEAELLALVEAGDRLDSFNAGSMILRLDHALLFAETCPVLRAILASTLVTARRQFDGHIAQRIQVSIGTDDIRHTDILA